MECYPYKEQNPSDRPIYKYWCRWRRCCVFERICAMLHNVAMCHMMYLVWVNNLKEMAVLLMQRESLIKSTLIYKKLYSSCPNKWTLLDTTVSSTLHSGLLNIANFWPVFAPNLILKIDKLVVVYINSLRTASGRSPTAFCWGQSELKLAENRHLHTIALHHYIQISVLAYILVAPLLHHVQ